MSKTAVVALGGNAITRSGQHGTHSEQMENARAMASAIRGLRESGWNVVLVHGNGPQVGNLAIQQRAASDQVPEMPLHVLGAMTEGQLGSLLALAVREAGGVDLPGVVTVVTHVVVRKDDPAFGLPTKPIGPFYTVQEAARLVSEQGWVVGEDAGRGYRRLVPSPKPVEIVELDAIRGLIDQGLIVVAAGGGGIPVVEEGGSLQGIDAVIDKDSAAQRLANALGAEALVLVTDVPAVMLDFGKDTQRAIGEITADEAQGHADDGQFPEGSMGPKMRAAIQFVREGGATAVVTNAARAVASLNPGAGDDAEPGTRIVAADQHLGAAP
ncbi:carbamate kinase [Pseudonocardia sp.]|jgi:carbamate kinase|uniref:carbamate kinase n=1 Tax=Pseudonocardia sp. TaxID=60912 RepID=UPI003D0B02D2